MIRTAKKPRLWFVILTLLTFVGWAPTDFVKHATSHRGGAVRLAAAGETWWCQGGGINGKLKDCFEENMQVDGVPLLKDYDTYQASLPVRGLRNGSLLTLYQLPFYARITDLNSFAERMSSELAMRTSVDYITAASHSGKSASVLVGFQRSRELDSGGDARLNFTHYLYMPFANNGGNYHDCVDEEQLVIGCGRSSKLREALLASFDCPAKKRHIFGAGSQEHFRFSKERKACLRRTSPPSCNAVQRACFWCTWMSTGLCVQTQTSGEVPWEYLQSFLVSRSWQPTLTFHPCPSRSLQKLADDRSHVCFQMWGQSWRSAYPWATSTWTTRQFCFVWQHCVWHLDLPCRSSSLPACTFHLVS